nr:MAG TPA: hypothetical protein [Bacteriophage sp.]DAX07444.1 MAG TPA: hypothetical protein [Bacteriophage sp.]DAX09842.1 MAG TPA: hypothetical protein [Bacteriophage sp.]
MRISRRLDRCLSIINNGQRAGRYSTFIMLTIYRNERSYIENNYIREQSPTTYPSSK